MKVTYIISLIITCTLLFLLGIALFDIVVFPPTAHGLIGVAAVITTAITIKLYIKLYKRTR